MMTDSFTVGRTASPDFPFEPRQSGMDSSGPRFGSGVSVEPKDTVAIPGRLVRLVIIVGVWFALEATMDILQGVHHWLLTGVIMAIVSAAYEWRSTADD